MQRKLIVTFSALLAVTFLIIVLSFFARHEEKKVVPSGPISALEALNRRNSAVQSISCPSIRSGLTTTFLFYEKHDKILFSTWFLTIRETLVGCDGTEYWFWIRSFNKKSLYFCDREKLNSTMLRPIMRPEVIGMIAWISEVKPETVASDRGFVARAKNDSMNILVEFDHEKIIAQTAFLNGNKIVTLEGKDFAEFSGLILPRKIKATWHEENMSGDFLIDNWLVNSKNPGIKPPQELERVNLEDYSSSSGISVSASSAQVPGGL